LSGGARDAMRRWAPVAVAAIVIVTAALFVYIPTYWAADLGPLPDAAEYAATARNLAHVRPYTIALYGHTYPPRYPFGFPALLAPSYWLPRSTLASGLDAVLVFGVATVYLVYTLARRIAGIVAGIGAAVVLILSPQFIGWNHELMSETAAMALVAGVALLVYETARHGPGRRRDVLLVVLGCVAGLAILVRLANIVVVAAVAAAILGNGDWRTSWRRSAIFVSFGPAAAILALASYAWGTFGSVTGTGYRFWAPRWYDALGRTFSLGYAVTAPGAAGDPHAPPGIPNLLYYMRGLAGRLAPASLDAFSAWFLLLATVGAVALVRDRGRGVRPLVLFGGVFIALTIGLYSLYFFQSVRFMAPLVPLLALSAGVATAGGLRALAHRAPRGAIARTGGLAVVVFAGIGIAVALGPSLRACYIYQWYVRGNRAPYAVQAQARTTTLYEGVVPGGSLIVSDLFPIILARGPIAARATIVPLSRSGYLRSDPLIEMPIFLGRLPEINASLHRGVPVFTDSLTLQSLLDSDAHDRAHALLRSYAATPVASEGPLVVYRLAATPITDATTTLPPILDASPNPVPAGGGYGVTTVRWDTGDGGMGQVYVAYDGGTEQLVDEGESGERVVPWIASDARYTFVLYRGTRREAVLATIVVTRGS
jgi:4-amino-4-deoxy-L-arabinose transferase-like glycosyltransferase